VIAKILVSDVLMPPIGLLLGGGDFSDLFIDVKEGAAAAAPYASLAAAQEAGAVTINYGVFLNTGISFLVVAFAVVLLIRGINRLQKQEAPAAATTKKKCQYCISEIAIEATRCARCTAQLT